MTTSRKAPLYAVVGALAVLAVQGPSVHAQPGQDRVRVILGFRQAPGAAEEAVVRAAGGRIIHTFWLAPAIAAEVPSVALQGLRNNPLVANLSVDTEVREIDAELDNSWGVKHIGSGVVHDSGNRGGGVRVCIIDSGIDYTHPDLSQNYLDGYDFVNDDSDPFDDRGHGTHVAGSLLARDNNAGVVGVAPEAKVLAYKILDHNGSGFISSAIAALQACITDGGQVTNNSYGSQTEPASEVKTAFDNAEALGLVHVAAAGNRTSFFGTCTTIAFPARYASVIAVTSVSSNNSIHSTSCRGPEAELAAPGVNITSTVPTGSCAHCTSSGYNTLTGTSMASPHVAGVAALIIASGSIPDSNSNGRINDEVRLRLQTTADDLGTTGRDNLYGYGLVDADEAAPPTPPDPPTQPTELAATEVSSSQINLTWTDTSDNESGFKIERCTGSVPCGSFTQIATVGAGVASFANTGLSASTAYAYRVRAYNGGGDSPYSNEVEAMTLGETIPAAPSKLDASAVSSSQINLTWSDNASNETGFVIERCQGDGCSTFAPVTTVGANTTSYSNAGLTASTSYSYRVAATNGAGTSAYSNTASATTHAAASLQLAVSGYKVQGRPKADLNWSGATSTNVDIYRNDVLITTTANDGFHTDNINNRGGGSYTYRVCEAGTATCSNNVTITF